jgi:hypothetical protein
MFSKLINTTNVPVLTFVIFNLIRDTCMEPHATVEKSITVMYARQMSTFVFRLAWKMYNTFKEFFLEPRFLFAIPVQLLRAAKFSCVCHITLSKFNL